MTLDYSIKLESSCREILDHRSDQVNRKVENKETLFFSDVEHIINDACKKYEIRKEKIIQVMQIRVRDTTKRSYVYRH